MPLKYNSAALEYAIALSFINDGSLIDSAISNCNFAKRS